MRILRNEGRQLLIALSTLAVLASPASAQIFSRFFTKPQPQVVEPVAGEVSAAPSAARERVSESKAGKWLDGAIDYVQRMFEKVVPARPMPDADARPIPDEAPKPDVVLTDEDRRALEDASKTLREFSNDSAGISREPPDPEALFADERAVRAARQALTGLVEQTPPAERTRVAPSKDQANVAAAKAVRERPTRAIADEVELTAVRDAASGNARSPLVVFKKSAARTEAQIDRALSQPIHSVHVLHALPRTAIEAERVHPGVGQYFGEPYWSNIAHRLAMSGATVSTPDVASPEYAAQQLARWAEAASPSELVVLVGHVDRGTMRFADGSTISVAGLSKRVRAPIVFLGCNTLSDIEVVDAPAHVANLSLGTGTYVGYNDAVKMVAEIAKEVAAHRNASLWTLLRCFQHSSLLETLTTVV